MKKVAVFATPQSLAAAQRDLLDIFHGSQAVSRQSDQALLDAAKNYLADLDHVRQLRIAQWANYRIAPVQEKPPEPPIFTYCESELVPSQFHEFHLD